MCVCVVGGGGVGGGCHGYHPSELVVKATPLLSGHQFPNLSSCIDSELNDILTWSHVRAVLAMGLIAFSGSLCISSSSYLQINKKK